MQSKQLTVRLIEGFIGKVLQFQYGNVGMSVDPLISEESFADCKRKFIKFIKELE